MKDVHIGHEIEQRIARQRMTKTDFARLIGKAQQNVSRIFSSPSIKTDELEKICEVLHFNFFRLWVDEGGDINLVASGDSSVAAINSDVNTADEAVLRERIRALEMLLKEKERMLNYLMAQGKFP